MKREHRLLKSKDYTHTIHHGESINSKSYVIYYQNNEVHHLRLGVTTSTKTGNAVVRNKVKRQVKAMLDYQLDLTRELDIVIIIKKNYLNYDFENNRRFLFHSLSQIERLMKLESSR